MIKKIYVNIIVLWQFLIIINVNAELTQVRMKIDVPIDSSSDATKNNDDNDDDDDLPQNDIKNELIKQGQFFRDLFSEQLSEHEIEFGHVCENPDEWEQRFERQDIKANNYRGKVKWGNKNGEYGEHYWDLNH